MCLQQKNIDDLQQSGEMDECSCAIVISFVIVSLYACSCAKYFDKRVVMLIIFKNRMCYYFFVLAGLPEQTIIDRPGSVNLSG